MKYIKVCEEQFEFVPCRDQIIKIIDDLRMLIFPGYFNCISSGIDLTNNKIKDEVKKLLKEQIYRAKKTSHKDLDEETLTEDFIDDLPQIVEVLKTDLQATFDGDPAALDFNEIILSYPGMLAISIYRIAHYLYEKGIPYIPRIMSEYAHSMTGIDIHPGARIGSYFFIDHGTGIVIGETSIIGEHVRIYQGVTLGALSLGRGQKLKGLKRHPTIGNNVTIYSGASILGGDTIIGDNVIIGSNTYILESVVDNMIVRLNKVDMEINKRN